MNEPKYTTKDMLWSWGMTALVAFVFALTMTGCNTVKGMATDIHAAAEGIQKEMSKGAE